MKFTDIPVWITGIYGIPETNQRHLMWNLLRNLHSGDQLPWFVGGDFIEILHSGEKKSGRICGPSQMSAFNSTLTECGSSNIGFEGFRYTWTNNRRVPGTVRCRLDRVCVNEEAIYLSLTTMVSHIEQPSLDHIPIFFRLARPDKPAPLSRGRPFRFEAMWIHKDDCEEIIHKVWRTLEDLIRLL